MATCKELKIYYVTKPCTSPILILRPKKLMAFPGSHGWGSQTQNSNASPLNGKDNL